MVPLEYLRSYGQFAKKFYNEDQGRFGRQSAAGEKGGPYVVASYRVLLYNLPIWAEYQTKQFLNSIGCSFRIDDEGEGAKHPGSAASAEFRSFVSDYYAVGGEGLENAASQAEEALVGLFGSSVKQATSWLYRTGWAISPAIKLFAVATVALLTVIAALRRRSLESLMGATLLLILAVIVMMAPATRANYYYYVYFGMYWYIIVITVSALQLRVRERFPRTALRGFGC